MLDGMSHSIQRSRIENLHSREVDRQSPTGLILFVCFDAMTAYKQIMPRLYNSTLTGMQKYNISLRSIEWCNTQWVHCDKQKRNKNRETVQCKWKKALRVTQTRALAAVRRSQKFSPRHRPPSWGRN